jgi:hypothetical protein
MNEATIKFLREYISILLKSIAEFIPGAFKGSFPFKEKSAINLHLILNNNI